MSDKLSPEELIAKQNETIAEQGKKIEELIKLINEPKTTITEKKDEPLKIPTELVEAKNKKYKWNVPAFKLPNESKTITAEQAATDPKIISAILKIEGQGILAEVV